MQLKSIVSDEQERLLPPPKILFYVTRYWPATAGASLHTRELIKHLAETFSVGVLRHACDEPYSKELAFARNPSMTLKDGLSTIHQVGSTAQVRWLLEPLAHAYQSVRLSRPLYDFLLRSSIQREVEKISQSYDIIHAVYTGMTASVRMAQKIAKRQRKPFVLTPLVHIDDPDQKAAPSLKQLYVESDALIVMTSFEKEWLVRQGVDPARIYLGPYGPLIKDAVDPQGFRAKHQLADAPFILFMGRQVPYKGYKPLTLAAEQVWKNHPTARFIFLGPSTPESEEFFKTVEDERILNLGVVSDADKCSALAACDIFCLPSLKESLGVVYLEAWEYKKPVISADIPVMAGMIDHENDGLILPPNSDAIAEGITRLLDHQDWRHQLGCQGYQKVRENYDWNQLTDRISKIYASFY